MGRGTERNRGSKESRGHYLGAMRGFQAATHDHCPRRGPGQISCRPEPGGLCTACDNWLRSLKNPKASQVVSENQVPLVLTGLPGLHLSSSPSLLHPGFCVEAQSPTQAHGACLGAGKGPVGLLPAWNSYSSLIFVQLLFLHRSLRSWEPTSRD